MDQVITPQWPAPAHVKAYTTTRLGGVSKAPFNSFNLGAHVGDDPSHVAHNRQQLKALLGFKGEVQWLNQIHSAEVATLPAESLSAADASFSAQPNVVCAVLTADCLPVLMTDAAGTQVAAAHAGWRGLCDGVLENTLAQFSEPTEVVAWLGPAIGPQVFEVGDEVRAAFVSVDPAAEAAFTKRDQPGKWLADLYQLARQRLIKAGCEQIYGGNECTYSDVERFYSYRRDQQTGRMASLIWLEK
ncbi:peptidoglycan editing factor PgeF [Marinomonas ostreistagni]|uniref:peptidoglycan editing factor PgeF n=1 Tax=Marinomonas ostreistagni TaxID=359209 RepID=UPI00194EC366|nr:peptidoglycan editing factor PgeF [Marinomonas ostreistagni]MBM6551594.1 peptidoglycan editing factor PgeF [Marinomonas ostreistagni]